TGLPVLMSSTACALNSAVYRLRGFDVIWMVFWSGWSRNLAHLKRGIKIEDNVAMRGLTPVNARTDPCHFEANVAMRGLTPVMDFFRASLVMHAQ
ncbi:hypothetical protein, partial [Phragmitibacter flavus]|uniref:hypothetical protein n=1 Tax=Phragmitibacter flavus TaxID=2576071 RepID=UPI00197D1B47